MISEPSSSTTWALEAIRKRVPRIPATPLGTLTSYLEAAESLLTFPRMVPSGRFNWTSTTVSAPVSVKARSEEHTSELQSHSDLVCRLLLEKKKKINNRGVALQEGIGLKSKSM